MDASEILVTKPGEPYDSGGISGDRSIENALSFLKYLFLQLVGHLSLPGHPLNLFLLHPLSSVLSLRRWPFQGFRPHLPPSRCLHPVQLESEVPGIAVKQACLEETLA